LQLFGRLFTVSAVLKTPRLNIIIGIVCWVAVACWAATILYLSSLSGNQIKPFMFGLPGIDKCIHAVAFATGAFLLFSALRQSTDWPLRKKALFAAIAISCFGVIDELHQLSTPQRSGADIADWIADCIGASIGALISFRIYVRFHRSPEAGSTSAERAPGA
jgi:hypothetical protein